MDAIKLCTEAAKLKDQAEYPLEVAFLRGLPNDVKHQLGGLLVDANEPAATYDVERPPLLPAPGADEGASPAG